LRRSAHGDGPGQDGLEIFVLRDAQLMERGTILAASAVRNWSIRVSIDGAA
jgi:hypothetical protein